MGKEMLSIVFLCLRFAPLVTPYGFTTPPGTTVEGDIDEGNDVPAAYYYLGQQVKVAWDFRGTNSSYSQPSTYTISLQQYPDSDSAASSSIDTPYIKNASNTEADGFTWTVSTGGGSLDQGHTFSLELGSTSNDGNAVSFFTKRFNIQPNAQAESSVSAAFQSSTSSMAGTSSGTSSVSGMGISSTGTGTGTSSSSTSPAASSQTPALSDKSSSGLSGGAIAGIAIGAVAAVALVAGGIWLFLRKFAVTKRVDSLSEKGPLNTDPKNDADAQTADAKMVPDAAEQHTSPVEGVAEVPDTPIAEAGDGRPTYEVQGSQEVPVELPARWSDR